MCTLGQWSKQYLKLFGSGLLKKSTPRASFWTVHRAEFFFAVAATIFWKCDIGSALKKAFPVFPGNLVCCFTPSKKRWFSSHPLSSHHLTRGVITVLHHALWRVCDKKVICVLGHCGVDTLHICTFEKDSMFCLFALHHHGHTDSALGFCQ